MTTNKFLKRSLALGMIFLAVASITVSQSGIHNSIST